MPDLRFYRRAGPFSLTDLAAMTGTRLMGADGARLVHDIGQVDTAGAGDIVYVAESGYGTALAGSACGACVTTEALAALAPSTCAVLIAKDPRAAFAVIAAGFYPDQKDAPQQTPVAPDAKVGKNVAIAPGAIIGSGATIGDNSSIGPNAVIGRGVTIGSGCRIGACVSLAYCVIGDRVILHAGVRIGEDGFGFTSGPSGLRKIPQLGRVIVSDDVEIGANTTIDRGTVGDTLIGSGTKIDNLVQIGHNVVIGRNCVIVAQVGISGSCRLGEGVLLGGQAGLADHVHIGDGARIGAKAGVVRDVGPGEAVIGYPARPSRQFWREMSALSRLTRRDKEP